MNYKIGSKILFSFLGERLKGEVISKVDAFRSKVQDLNGFKYIAYNKPPNKKEKVLSYIIKKINL